MMNLFSQAHKRTSAQALMLNAFLFFSFLLSFSFTSYSQVGNVNIVGLVHYPLYTGVATGIQDCINYDFNKPIGKVNIEFRNNSNTNQLFGAALSNLSTTTVNYQVNGLSIPTGTNLRVTAWKDFDWINGVTTADANLLNKHILATQRINNRWVRIAGDLNNNGTLSVADLILMQQLILGNITNLYPQGLRSWRFTNMFEFFQAGNVAQSFCTNNTNFANAPFSQSTTPKYPEYLDMNLYYGTLVMVSNPFINNNYISFPNANPFFQLDFFGIKVGDLNSNANLNYVAKNKVDAIENIASARDGSSNNQFLNTNIVLKKGSKVTVPVYLSSSQAITSFQMGINFDFSKLKFVKHTDNTKFGLTPEENWGLTKVDSGRLRMLYIDKAIKLTPIALGESGTKIFSLEFEALENIENLENLITQTDEELPLLAYNDNDEVYSSLFFDVENIKNLNAIIEAYPNPFNEKTTLNLYSDNAEQSTIVVIAMDGRKVYKEDVALSKGFNQVEVNLTDIAAGTYIVTQIDTNGAIKSKIRIIKK